MQKKASRVRMPGVVRPNLPASCRKLIKGAELDFLIVPTEMKSIEVGDTIDVEHDGLAVNHEPLDQVLLGGVYDPGKALSPIIAAARNQPHGIASRRFHRSLSRYVSLAPKATEALRCSEMTRWARKRHSGAVHSDCRDKNHWRVFAPPTSYGVERNRGANQCE